MRKQTKQQILMKLGKIFEILMKLEKISRTHFVSFMCEAEQFKNSKSDSEELAFLLV